MLPACCGQEADKNVSRAQAMRQSMLEMIEKGKPFEAYPEPFVVVGEGAAR